MDCLVTGGAGFVGSNLVDALVARGDAVTVIDNLSTGKRSNLEGGIERGVRLEEVDVRDADAVTAVFAAASPEVVFHMAAQIDVRYSVEHPAGDATTNVLGAIAVLDAARETGVTRLVNTSTGGGLYGDADRLPTPEDYPIRPLARALHPVAWPLDRLTSLRQRVWAATGRPRGGWRGGDLLRPPDGRADADDLWRRRADP
jgi:UDP-glucose 4-epimerase